MELDGSVQKNLISALRSAKRLRGEPVHADTLAHWASILNCAETELSFDGSPDGETLKQLVSDLHAELASRRSSSI